MAEQLLTSVTVTKLVDVLFTVMVPVVAVVLHIYEAAAAGLELAVKSTDPPWQNVVGPDAAIAAEVKIPAVFLVKVMVAVSPLLLQKYWSIRTLTNPHVEGVNVVDD